MVLADVSEMPDLSWVGAALLAAVWFIGAFALAYRVAVAYDGRESRPMLAGAVVLFAAWTVGLGWLASGSLPE